MNIHISGSISSSKLALKLFRLHAATAGRRGEATGEENSEDRGEATGEENGKMQGTARRRKWGRCKATGEESVDCEYSTGEDSTDPPGISRSNAKSAASIKAKHYAGEEQSLFQT